MRVGYGWRALEHATLHVLRGSSFHDAFITMQMSQGSAGPQSVFQTRIAKTGLRGWDPASCWCSIAVEPLYGVHRRSFQAAMGFLNFAHPELES